MSFVESILEYLQDNVEDTASLLDAILQSTKGSYGALWRSAYRGERSIRFKRDWAGAYRDRKRFLSTLSRLKREGLVVPANKQYGLGRLWRLTHRGRKKIAAFKAKRSDVFSAAHIQRYTVSRSGITVLVVFDIPEKEKRKRRWLRESLKWLQFTMLQRSVWLGRGSLPEEFLRDIRALKLQECVHILSISKSGTIESIKTK